MLWEKTFGDNGIKEYGNSVKQTTDGGYILLGTAGHANTEEKDFYLIKTDELGNKLWEKNYGGTGNDEGAAILQTTDGGYIIVGHTDSEGAGLQDIMLLKTDNGGNLVWKKIFGGTGIDLASSVQQTTDGGYIISGTTEGFTPPIHLADAYMLKTDGQLANFNGLGLSVAINKIQQVRPSKRLMAGLGCFFLYGVIQDHLFLNLSKLTNTAKCSKIRNPTTLSDKHESSRILIRKGFTCQNSG